MIGGIDAANYRQNVDSVNEAKEWIFYQDAYIESLMLRELTRPVTGLSFASDDA